MNFPEGKWTRYNAVVIITTNFDEDDNHCLKTLDEFPGVYTIWNTDSKECLYIGSSKNVRNRVITHLMTKKELKKYKNMYVKVRKDKYRYEHLTLEARLIYKLQPKYNKAIRGLGIKAVSINKLVKSPDVRQLIEDLKPIISGKEKRLNHLDKDKDLI